MRVWRTLLSVALIVWLIDLATKIWAVNFLSSRANVRVIGELFQLTFVRNPGAAFSFATGATFILTFFSILVLSVILYFLPKITSKGWAVVLGLVMGGILGNLSDRVFREPGFFRGHVIDWMQLPHWPIFNIADSAIVVAALISMILSIRNISPIQQTSEK